MAAGSHRLSEHGTAIPSSPQEVNRPTKFTCLLYNTIISGFRDHIVRTIQPQTLLQHHFFLPPRHMNSLPQSITSPCGAMRLMSRRSESFRRGSTEPKFSSQLTQSLRPGLATSTSLPTCLPYACTMLAALDPPLKNRDSPLAPDRAISLAHASCSLAWLTDHILTQHCQGDKAPDLEFSV